MEYSVLRCHWRRLKHSFHAVEESVRVKKDWSYSNSLCVADLCLIRLVPNSTRRIVEENTARTFTLSSLARYIHMVIHKCTHTHTRLQYTCTYTHACTHTHMPTVHMYIHTQLLCLAINYQGTSWLSQEHKYQTKQEQKLLFFV